MDPTSPTPSQALSEPTAPATCPVCGKSESLKRCSSCKSVSYCSREHQRQHWKVHRAECTYQSKQAQPEQPSPNASDMVVVVEIKSGEGSGLTNRMVNHVFSSRVQATRYIRQRLGYDQTDEMKELTEMPFLKELMGFSTGVLYVDPRQNAFPPFNEDFNQQFGFGFELDELNDMLNCRGVAGELNAMAIYLGSNLDTGLSMSVNASGDAFFIGTTAKGKPVTSNVLWGAANFVYEGMDYYPPDDHTQQEREQIFRKWSLRYTRGTWQPMAGNGGFDLYQTDPFRCAALWPTVDHRTP
ncbi:Egl nine 1 [Phytophthora cinnamomi]|uniref:Egl nine 1 n=1 Tax=Phytophthora cinnamomi TaxID=4785 RepID=UPI00355A0815|nr:Egl nine 1 [Phytophthora cinnamomi]